MVGLSEEINKFSPIDWKLAEGIAQNNKKEGFISFLSVSSTRFIRCNSILTSVEPRVTHTPGGNIQNLSSSKMYFLEMERTSSGFHIATK